MSTPLEHKHYTVQDIERYHSGKMSAQEMHALEEAALDDPFLADALEGYTLSVAPSKEVIALENRLKERIDQTGKTRSGIIFSNWFRIAALLVIIAGAGLFIYLQTNNKNTAVAVTKTSEPSAPLQNDHTIVVTDSSNTHLKTSVPPEDQTMALKERPQHLAGKGVNKKQYSEKHEDNNQYSPPSAAVESAPATALRSEKVYGLDNKKETAQAATAATLMKKPETISPFKDKDSTDNLAYNKQRRPEAESTSVYNEVVVQKAQVTPARKAAAGKTRMQNMENNNAPEPVNGWKEFENYITTHKKAPVDSNGKSMNGEVQLSFDINADGQPINIRVDQSLNTAYDLEAIRLLKKGPKWKAKDQTSARVTIRF